MLRLFVLFNRKTKKAEAAVVTTMEDIRRRNWKLWKKQSALRWLVTKEVVE